MNRTKLFRVVGVNRETGTDVDAHIEALSVANAKIKAEMQGVEVTSVQAAKRPRPKPAIKPWQFQTVRSTGFGLPWRVTIWFTLLMAAPAAMFNGNSPFNAGVSDGYTLGAWLGAWCMYAIVIHAIACIPAYLAWRLFKQDRNITGNVYVVSAVALAIIFLYAIALSVGILGEFMN